MTLGSWSSPASAVAGSPGNSCCSPKIRMETKNSVGTIVARRWRRNLNIGIQDTSASPANRARVGPRSVELQVLHPHQPVGHDAQAAQLGAIGPQPVAVEQVDDGPVLRDMGLDLLEQLQARRRVGGRARPVDQLVDLGLAVAGVVPRLSLIN